MDFDNSAIYDSYNHCAHDEYDDDDVLYAPEDNLEGTPSEFSTGHISDTHIEPSLSEESLSVAEDDLEGTPSEFSIGHDSNAPTEPPSDEEEHSTFSGSSSASRVMPSLFDRPSPPRQKLCRNGGYHLSAVRRSFAAHAAAIRRQSRPAGTPSGSVRHSLPPGIEQGTPCSAARPLASTTSRADEADPANGFEQQLTRLLFDLAKAKSANALIHVAAAESSAQLRQLLPQARLLSSQQEDAYKMEREAVAVHHAWLKHLDGLALPDRPAWTAANDHYDRSCKEHGLVVNLARAEELVAMLRAFFHEAVGHLTRLQALPPKQKNEAFTIVGKMPPAKLYERPGTPGHHFALKGGRSVKEGHGTPCHPKSEPTPGSNSVPTSKPTPGPDFVSTRRSDRQQHATSESSQSDNTDGPAPRRPYCVFCGRHAHWSSDCSAHDLRTRWQIINHRKLCRQCLRASHLTADCVHASRRCKHCAAYHHAALCPKPHQRFLPSSDDQPSPVSGHPSVATAAGGPNPPDSPATTPPADAHRNHDDRHTTTNPLDTKPPSSSPMQPSAAADVEPSEHRLAKSITSFFQRNSAGNDVVVGFYARSQDDFGRTFYRILKPMEQPSLTARPVDALYAHLGVDRVFMVETTMRLLPRDSLLPSNATPDADSRHSTRWSTPTPSGSCFGVAATDLSGVTPRRTAVASDLATAMRTPLLPRPEALSPTTTDSATTEVEPEDHDTASRRSRRKRGQRQTQHRTARSTSYTQSTPSMQSKSQRAQLHATESVSSGLNPTASVTAAPAGYPAGKKGTPFATSLACNGLPTLQRPPPSSITSDAQATSSPAQRSFAAGGPSTLEEMPMAKPQELVDDCPADPEENGNPFLALGCGKDMSVKLLKPTPPTSKRQLPLKRVRTWTSSSRKKTPPELLPSTTSFLTPSRTGHIDRADSGATASSSRDEAKRNAMNTDHSATLVIARKHTRSATLVTAGFTGITLTEIAFTELKHTTTLDLHE